MSTPIDDYSIMRFSRSDTKEIMKSARLLIRKT